MKRMAIAAACFLATLSAQAEGQWRVGAHAAFSDFEGDESFPVDDSTVGFKLTGQYKFNKWLGAEGAYYNSADFEEDLDPGSPGGDVEISFKGFSISGIGYIPLPGNNDNIDLFGKVGYYDFDVDLTGALPGVTGGITTSLGHDDGLTVGGGTAVRISEKFGIRAEFDWYDIENSDMWAVAMGLEYRF